MPEPNRWDRKSVLQMVQQYVQHHDQFFDVSSSLPFMNECFAGTILLFQEPACEASSCRRFIDSKTCFFINPVTRALATSAALNRPNSR